MRSLVLCMNALLASSSGTNWQYHVRSAWEGAFYTAWLGARSYDPKKVEQRPAKVGGGGSGGHNGMVHEVDAGAK